MKFREAIQQQWVRLTFFALMFNSLAAGVLAAQEPAAIRGMIGVGTYNSQAEFRDIEVTQRNKTLFTSDFSQGMQGWKEVSGTWEVQDGVLRQTSNEEYARVLAGDPNWSDYTLKLKARKIGGNEGFLIFFGVPDEGTISCWNVGGWGNTAAAFQSPSIPQQQVPGQLETGTWYDIKIELKGDSVRGFFNNRPLQKANRDRSIFTSVPPTHIVKFSTQDAGQKMPLTHWGLDTSWDSYNNMRRGVAYLGEDNIDVVRVAFMTDEPIVNGDLTPPSAENVAKRIKLAQLAGDKPIAMLKHGGKGDTPWVQDGDHVNPERWAQIIAVSAKRYGKKLESVEPFNEPDFDRHQGDARALFDVLGVMKNSPAFAGVLLAGPGTLNCDQAMPWYQVCKSRLDMATTHALAGTMKNYVDFYKRATADGKKTQNAEAHNLVEVIAGAEYGLQSAIWWGTAELARGQFATASKGVRLGYAEDLPRWTCAAVYRNPDGKVQAFIGASERMAATTNYKFVCTDRDVYFDGRGPQREFEVTVPGGLGYMSGQISAEKVINITWGEDIPQPILGSYVIVNRNSKLVLDVADGSNTDGADIVQTKYKRQLHQVWDVAPWLASGDLSYFTVNNFHSKKAMDTAGHSYEDGGRIQQWGESNVDVRQWYFEYEGDNWFYIRSRWSNKCLGIAGASKEPGAPVQQFTWQDHPNLHWRLLPTSILKRSTIDLKSPKSPNDLSATAKSGAVELKWSPNSEKDLVCYLVFRSPDADGPYDLIARSVGGNSFTDKKVKGRGQYFYKVKAMDRCFNLSEFSKEADCSL